MAGLALILIPQSYLYFLYTDTEDGRTIFNPFSHFGAPLDHNSTQSKAPNSQRRSNLISPLYQATMKASTILGWKYLVSKIHPPLPMNQRESQKLLSALKSSFQRHLDREHPRSVSMDGGTVDHHIHSILANPLFSVKPKRRASSANHFDGHVESLSQLRHLMKQPMDYFKDEISAGTATLGSAKTCLTAQLQKALASPKENRSKALRSSGAGAVVLNWLWSSPGAKSDFFLLDKAFIKSLMPFLNAESHEKLIWYWIKRLQEKIENEPSTIKRPQARMMQAIILHYFLKSEVLYGAGLSSAMEVFFRGVVGIPSWSGISSNDAKAILEQAGRYMMLNIVQNPSSATAVLWNSFIPSSDVWSSSPRLHKELLGLYFSEAANTALKFIKEQNIYDIKNLNRSQRQDMFRLNLKAAELLLSQGLEVKAAWVMGFLQTHFAIEIGYSAQDMSSEACRLGKQQRQRHSEECSLRLLDTLAVH